MGDKNKGKDNKPDESSQTDGKQERPRHSDHIFEGLKNDESSPKDGKEPKKRPTDIKDIDEHLKKIKSDDSGGMIRGGAMNKSFEEQKRIVKLFEKRGGISSNLSKAQAMYEASGGLAIANVWKEIDKQERIRKADFARFKLVSFAEQSLLDSAGGLRSGTLALQALQDAVGGTKNTASAIQTITNSVIAPGVLNEVERLALNGPFSFAIKSFTDSESYSSSDSQAVLDMINPNWRKNEGLASFHKVMGRTYEWEDDQLKEIQQEPVSHPEFEAIQANIYPQMTIRDIAIIRHPYSGSKRKKFTHYLVRLVASGILKSMGNFINPRQLEYLVIHRDDYVECHRLEIREEHSIPSWFDSSPQTALRAPRPNQRPRRTDLTDIINKAINSVDEDLSTLKASQILSLIARTNIVVMGETAKVVGTGNERTLLYDGKSYSKDAVESSAKRILKKNRSLTVT